MSPTILFRWHRLACLLPLILALGCASAPEPEDPAEEMGWPAFATSGEPIGVGFDFDDTLVFSSAVFVTANDEIPHTDNVRFWALVNSLDRELSVVKQTTLTILKRHQSNGDRIYVVTARHPSGGDKVAAFIEETFGIPRENVYFETEGKAERIDELNLKVFYGDADSDITAALTAGARPVRISRSAKSSYKKKYNPGRYGETIVDNSEE